MSSLECCIGEILKSINLSQVKNVYLLGKFAKEYEKNLKDKQVTIDEECKFEKKLEGQYDLVVACEEFSRHEDNDVKIIVDKVLTILKNDSSFVFCEPCYESTGEGIKARNPAFYFSILSTALHKEENDISIFEVSHASQMTSTIKFFWKALKIKSEEGGNEGFKSFQDFLDRRQYSLGGIFKYEKIFGEGFVSTGGFKTTEEFVGYLNLKEREKVLDVGSGIGGGDFYMAQKFKVHVTGLDLSSNMVNIAWDRKHKNQINNVEFIVCDATKKDFEEGSYDVIYSRDTILHIKDKFKLFQTFYKWLKPGGRLLISDYCCKVKPWSQDFQKYVNNRGYHLIPVEEYGKLIENSGFVDVIAENRTNQFVDVLNLELNKFIQDKNEFLKDFDKNDFDSIENGWKDKLKRCADGDQVWGLFRAIKK